MVRGRERRQYHRLTSAFSNRDGQARALDQMQRIPRCLGNSHVAKHTGQPNQVDAPMQRGIKDSHRVIDARIRVDQKFDFFIIHGKSLCQGFDKVKPKVVRGMHHGVAAQAKTARLQRQDVNPCLLDPFAGMKQRNGASVERQLRQRQAGGCDGRSERKAL